MNARAASFALVLLGSVPAAAADRTFVERAAAPGPVHLLVFQDGGRFFALRTRLDAHARPALARGYSLFCGTWTVQPDGISVTSALAESFRYPALAADRAGPRTRTYTLNGATIDASGATLRADAERYARVPRLGIEAKRLDGIREVCARH